jgi:hypothetical protein
MGIADHSGWPALEGEPLMLALAAGWCGSYCLEHRRTCRSPVSVDLPHEHACLIDLTSPAPAVESERG